MQGGQCLAAVKAQLTVCIHSKDRDVILELEGEGAIYHPLLNSFWGFRGPGAYHPLGLLGGGVHLPALFRILYPVELPVDVSKGSLAVLAGTGTGERAIDCISKDRWQAPEAVVDVHRSQRTERSTDP